MPNKQNGFTLIETLIGITILGFVVVTVLAAFSQVQMNTSTVGDKNLAAVLAESKIEELLKFPGSELTASTTPTIDYAVRTGDSFYVQSSDPKLTKQFRRSTLVTENGNFHDIQVTVEYGRVSAKAVNYPFRVTFNSRRGG